MSFRDPHFPRSLNPLPEGGVLDAYYAQQHLVLPPKGRNFAGTVCRVFEDKFELTLDGTTAIPIVFGPQVPDTRSLITKVMGWDHPPVIAHTPMTGEGYLVKGNAQEARNIFPGDNVDDVGNGWQLVRRQPREAIYSEKSGECMEVIDHREQLASQSLLAPQSRAALERHGKIVYESDPRHAHKLAVGIKHFHGFPTSYLEYLAFDPELAEAFKQHQDEICAMQGDMLALTPGMQTYLETFYEQNDPTQAADAQACFVECDVQRHNMNHFKRMPNLMSPVSVGFLECDVTKRIVAGSVGHPSLGDIRGDGRMEYEERERKKARDLQRDRAANAGGGVGIAADLVKRQGRHHDYVFDKSHQELVTRINQQVGDGQTAMVVYGGGHFETGYQGQRLDRKLLEKYTALLPDVQMVVVEPHSYETLVKRDEVFKATLEKFTNKQSFHYVRLLVKLEELIVLLRITVLGAHIEKLPSLDAKLRQTVEEMRLVFHPKAGSR